MSSVAVNQSYMPVDAGAKFGMPAESHAEAGQLKLALVIPTLCEAENICGLLSHVRSILDPLAVPYEILVVDDDSCDGTAEVEIGRAHV